MARSAGCSEVKSNEGSSNSSCRVPASCGSTSPESAPRQENGDGSAGLDILHRRRDALQGHLELWRQTAVAGAHLIDVAQRQRQHLSQAAQARVLCQRGEQRLSAGHHAAGGLQFIDRQIKQSVPSKKRIASWMEDIANDVGMLRQRCGELVRRRFSPAPE